MCARIRVYVCVRARVVHAPGSICRCCRFKTLKRLINAEVLGCQDNRSRKVGDFPDFPPTTFFQIPLELVTDLLQHQVPIITASAGPQNALIRHA